MQSRLVPALVVVLLLVAPLAGTPAGAATTEPAASGGSATPTAAAQADNATSIPGVGVVGDTTPAPGGGTYLVGTASSDAPNLTVTRLAANGSVAWQRTLGGANDSRGGQAVAATDDGVFVLELAGPARDRPGTPLQGTARMVQLSPDGAVQWTRELGEAYRTPGGSDLLAADGDGVVFARPVRGDPPGTRLVRLTAGGAVDWNRSYTGGVPRAVAVADGDYLVGGQRTFGEAWLLRVGADGSVQANRSYGEFHDRRVVGVVPTDDGGALLAGSASVRGLGQDDPWVARVDADGVPVWSRTYPSDGAFPRTAVPTEAGVLVVHTTSPEFGPRRTQLTHVGSDGSVGTQRLSSVQYPTTVRITGGTVQLYGAEFDRPNRTLVGTVDTAQVPGLEPDDREATALESNTTAYRGQNLEFAGATGVSYELYRLPNEYTEFDRPRLTRRLGDGAGSVAFESATLPSGRYAVRTADGYWLALDGGEGAGITTNASAAAFELEEDRVRFTRPVRDRRGPRFTRPGANRTVVETFRGERGVQVRVDSEREAFTARVGLTRLNGSSPGVDALDAALSADPQFGGTTEAAGQPYGVVEMAAGGDRNVTLDAGALPAGLYRLSVTPLDTADAAESGTTRLVVVREQREVGLAAADESLTLPSGGEVTTNLTLSGADAGISAVRVEAERTGGPSVALRLGLSETLDTGSASGGGSIGTGSSGAETQSLEVRDSPNGTFAVAELSLRSDPGFARGDTPVTGNNTLTAELAWVVDSEGVPYSLGEPVTVRYEVTEATDESGESDG